MRTLLTPLLSIAILATTSCGPDEKPHKPDPPKPPAEPVSAWPATAATDLGTFKVTVQPSDGAIERNKHFSMLVTLDQVKGDGDAAAIKLTADADMPAHQHGMNTQPEVKREDDNKYQVDGMLFHMAGEWVITVTVIQGTETEKATFPVVVE